MSNTPIPPHAFTLRAEGPPSLVNMELQCRRPDEQSPCVVARSIVSTATLRTRLSDTVIQALAVEPLEGIANEPIYQVDIYLPNHIRCAGIGVGRWDDPRTAQYDCLIGLDILALGDLSLSHFGGQTQFSFRAPAHGGVDYVVEQNQAASNPAEQPSGAHRRGRTPRGIPATRDQYCPCGSGKKHKNCCGKFHRTNSSRGRKRRD